MHITWSARCRTEMEAKNVPGDGIVGENSPCKGHLGIGQVGLSQDFLQDGVQCLEKHLTNEELIGIDVATI